MLNIVLVIIVFIIWAAVHSLTSMTRFKTAVRDRVGARVFAGFYRLFYNAVSVVTILPLFVLLATIIPYKELWRWPAPTHYVALAIQAVGAVGLLVSLWQTDIFRFLGLRQAYLYLQGDPDPNPPAVFVSRGTYRLVRHPLYFFSLLFLWFTPIMTLNSLVFYILATIYFLVGAAHEERRLAAAFGADYRRYQREVPYLIPFIGWK